MPDDEVTRVKGLGFLRDKNTADCFNARVITKNGKITSEKMKKLALFILIVLLVLSIAGCSSEKNVYFEFEDSIQRKVF